MISERDKQFIKLLSSMELLLSKFSPSILGSTMSLTMERESYDIICKAVKEIKEATLVSNH